MAEFKLSRLKYNWKGQWSASAQYIRDDIVSFGAKVYVCLVQHVGDSDFYLDLNFTNTDTPPLAVPKWELISDGITWKNQWQTSTYYVIGDLIKYGGTSYLCVEPHTSADTEAGFPEDYQTEGYWTIFLSTDSWKILWVVGNLYKVGDVVKFGANVYRCLTTHVSAATNQLGLISDLEKWEEVSVSNSWKGEWQVSTLYYPNDLVSYGGQIYNCASLHTSADTAAAGLEDALGNWIMFVPGVEYRGVWAQNTRYKNNDIVKYGSYLYLSIFQHTTEIDAVFNAQYWQQYVPGLEFDNIWSNAVLYAPGDVVRYGGNLFFSNNHSVASVPDVDPLNPDWTVLFEGTRVRGEYNRNTNYRIGDLIRRQGQMYFAKIDVVGIDVDIPDDGTSIAPQWELFIPGDKWQGTWSERTVFVIGDIVGWRSAAFRCIGMHLSDYHNRPDQDEPGEYWQQVAYGDPNNVLQEKGDIRTFGSSEDGSSVGIVRIPIGDQGQTLTAGETEAAWNSFNASAKVFFVAPNGLDTETAGASANEPFKTINYALDRIVGPATLFVKTGIHEEILPLRVPPRVAVVGDELRGTVVKAAEGIITAADQIVLTNVLSQMAPLVGNVILKAPIGTTDQTSPAFGSFLFSDLFQDLSGNPGTTVESAAATGLVLEILDRATNNTTKDISGTNTITSTAVVLAAAQQLENNREFLNGEITAFLREALPNFATDINTVNIWINKIVSAIIHDFRYPGNYKSQQAGEYFYHGANAAANKKSDMFRFTNGTGLRNMTVVGLSGELGDLNTNLTRRPTAGAYAALDPGYGVSDSTVWIVDKSPYVQNVTTFGTACVGLKIDGDLHAGGNKSIVSNDFTQILSDGIGIWCNGQGLTEAVSVFSYYNHIGYLSTNGGKIRGTNGNSSYGTFGAVAEGFNGAETPISGTVNNRFYQADIRTVFADGNDIQKLFYSNAGVNYTQAEVTIIGAGLDANVLGDETRDGGVYEIRVIDPGDSSGVGGSGYTFNKNQAQEGGVFRIRLAASDDRLAADYFGLRVVIASGTGAGQYAYIAAFDDSVKDMFVAKESKAAIAVTSTASSGNVLTVINTSTLSINDPIIFSGTLFGNIQPYTIYYVLEIVSSTQIRVSDTESGAAFNLVNGTGDMAINASGWNHWQEGTEIAAVLDTTSSYVIEPRLVFTSPGITSTESELPSESSWSSIAFGNATYVAISGGNKSAYSSDGLSWTAVTLPLSSTWNKIVYGKDAALFVAVSGDGAVLTTVDGIAWTVASWLPGYAYTSAAQGDGIWILTASGGTKIITANFVSSTFVETDLPEGADWNDIVYGKSKWVVVAQSDSTITNTVYSDDGVTWNLGSFAGGCKSLAYGNNRFVAVEGGYAGANTVFWSFDGITWETVSIATQNWQQVVYGNGLFVLVASNVAIALISTDGIDWREVNIETDAPWSSVAFGAGSFVLVGGTTPSDITAKVRTGATAQARITLNSGRVSSVDIWEPGGGYVSAPALSIVDPNNNVNVTTVVRFGDGVLANGSIVNSGTGYVTTSSRATLVGDGYKDQFQVGRELVVDSLERIPGPGDNLNIIGIDDYVYKVLTATVLAGVPGNYRIRLVIAKTLGTDETPEHDTEITIRQQYSQVRLTNHDFLDIGLGNFEQTNYPDTLFPNGTVLAPQDEVKEAEGGRVFYTSSDQDGNFRVGELFAVEQSTGTVTISADFFELQGLEELALGGISVGGSGVVIREFSTDPLFIADSNNIVPTQAAIKAFIGRRISGGGADAFTAQLVAGVVQIGPTAITTTTGSRLNFPVKIRFTQPVKGDMLIQSFFLGGDVTEIDD